MPGEPWLAEREPLSRFLQVVLFEAIMGAAHGASAASIDEPQVEAVVAPLERLPLGCWRWPSDPSCFYVGADVLAFAGPNGPSPDGPADHFLFVAARTPAALSYLRDLAGIEWDSGPGDWWST